MRIYRHCYWIDGWGINTRANNRDAAIASNAASEASQILSPVLQPIALLSQALAQASKPITLHGIVLAPAGSKQRESKVEQTSATDGEESAPAVPLKDTSLLPRRSSLARGN